MFMMQLKWNSLRRPVVAVQVQLGYTLHFHAALAAADDAWPYSKNKENSYA